MNARVSSFLLPRLFKEKEQNALICPPETRTFSDRGPGVSDFLHFDTFNGEVTAVLYVKYSRLNILKGIEMTSIFPSV